MKLNSPITIILHPYTDTVTNQVVHPEPLIMDELNVTYYYQPKHKFAGAQIERIPNTITLFFGEEYDSFINGGNLSWPEQRLRQLLGDDPQSYLQNLIPRTLEADPNGPGTILTNMIKTIGIKSSPNCTCRRHAIEMNTNGNDWCENNMPTILGWLEEESKKRNLPFIKSVAKIMVQRSINRSRKLLNRERQ